MISLGSRCPMLECRLPAIAASSGKGTPLLCCGESRKLLLQHPSPLLPTRPLPLTHQRAKPQQFSSSLIPRQWLLETLLKAAVPAAPGHLTSTPASAAAATQVTVLAVLQELLLLLITLSSAPPTHDVTLPPASGAASNRRQMWIVLQNGALARC